MEMGIEARSRQLEKCGHGQKLQQDSERAMSKRNTERSERVVPNSRCDATVSTKLQRRLLTSARRLNRRPVPLVHNASEAPNGHAESVWSDLVGLHRATDSDSEKAIPLTFSLAPRHLDCFDPDSLRPCGI
jgi:hypothetical protein